MRAVGLAGRRTRPMEPPVELRFVDMLLIIIAVLMFLAVVLALTGANAGSGSRGTELRVATRNAPVALAGRRYELALAARGGDGSYTWRVISGALPAGLTLLPDGTIQGVPTRVQTAQATVAVTDAHGRSGDRPLGFTVRPVGTGESQPVTPHVESPTVLLDDAVDGRPYRHSFQADVGTPQSWRITRGDLPKGVQLASDGTLSGRPEKAGESTFSVTMSDVTGLTATQRVRMIVKSAPESLLWRMFGWMRTAITWFGYFLVGITALTLIIGTPGGPPRPGLVHLVRRKRYGAWG